MQATMKAPSEIQVRDEYLGYEIEVQDGSYVATPMGWKGDILQSESMPTLRRKIWRWWHQL